jgi:hypothetical protein
MELFYLTFLFFLFNNGIFSEVSPLFLVFLVDRTSFQLCRGKSSLGKKWCHVGGFHETNGAGSVGGYFVQAP